MQGPGNSAVGCRHLPGAEEGGEDQRGKEPALHPDPSRRARIACSRAAMKSGAVAASSRSLTRGAGARSSAMTRAGRAESTTTRSERWSSRLDVVGDEDDGARIGPKGPGQPPLHLGSSDRVK